MRPPTYIGKTIVIKVPPSSYWTDTPAEARRWERQIRDDLDALVRGYLRVGPRSKTVMTRLVDES